MAESIGKTAYNYRKPSEAFEDVPVFNTVTQTVIQPVKQLDCNAMRVVTVNQPVPVQVQVPTGQTQKQLRADWRFKNGELYRKPTVNDIDWDALIKSMPQLPQWILDRVKAGQAVSMDIKTLTEQIRQKLAAKATDSKTNQTALAGSKSQF